MTKRTGTKRTTTSGPKRDRFAEITEHFISLIEAGAADPSGWQMPWVKLGTALPRNAATGKRYRGINTLVFAWTAIEAEAPAIFATFKQWQGLGCQVQRGEKGTAGVYWTPVRVNRADPTDERTKMIPTTFVVFHIDQVADVEGSEGSRAAILDKYCPTREVDPEVVYDAAEVALAGVPAVVKFGGDRAYYSGSDDAVTLPERHQFSTRDGLYSTWCHELTHWTGNAKRLARDGIVKFDTFGSEQYAFEELVAELGATFLCQELGVSSTPRIDHAQYLANWLKVLRNDSRALYRAASQAEKACAYVVERLAGAEAGSVVAEAEGVLAEADALVDA